MTEEGASGRAVFLDRDGVINEAVLCDGRPYPPPDLASFRLYDGAVDAVARLRAAGFRVIVVTNQPDVRTGKQTREVVDAMHERLRRELAIDDVRACFHVDADDCACRKPKPGMLFEAALAWRLSLALCFLVGDRWRDVEAGRAAGCRTFWIDRGYRERRPDPDWTVASLGEAADRILGIDRGEARRV